MSFAYYRWFPGDYARDTGHLTMLQHGAYRQLLDAYMATGKPLRGDLHAMHRICGALSGEERQAVEFALTEFFIKEGPVWRHARCDREIKHLANVSEAGRSAAAMRWHYDRNATALRTQSDGNANQNQNQITTKSKTKTKTARAKRAQPSPKTAMPEDFAISDRVRDWAEDKGYANLPAYFESFVGKARMHQYRYADWDAALMTSIREDWGKVRAAKPGSREPTRAERHAANVDDLCGGNRERTVATDDLDRKTVRTLPRDLRQPDEPGVGGDPEERPRRDLDGGTRRDSD